MRVPGAKVDGPNTAASLLEIAVWSLREQEFLEVEQIRAVRRERVVTIGGHSFTRVMATGRADTAGGLERELLAKVRARDEAGTLGRAAATAGRLVSGDDEHGLRGFILALPLSSGSPWASVAEFCRSEARAAGIVELQGRLIKKPVISDKAALEALRARDAEIAAARAAYREREAALDEAVIGDCIAAIHWAHQTPGG